jgi:hypothetical protein
MTGLLGHPLDKGLISVDGTLAEVFGRSKQS